MGTQARPLQAAQSFEAEVRQRDSCWQDPEKEKPHLLEQGAGGLTLEHSFSVILGLEPRTSWCQASTLALSCTLAQAC